MFGRHCEYACYRSLVLRARTRVFFLFCMCCLQNALLYFIYSLKTNFFYSCNAICCSFCIMISKWLYTVVGVIILVMCIWNTIYRCSCSKNYTNINVYFTIYITIILWHRFIFDSIFISMKIYVDFTLASPFALDQILYYRCIQLIVSVGNDNISNSTRKKRTRKLLHEITHRI